MLETGAIYSLAHKEDLESFESYLIQLKAFYPLCREIIPNSEKEQLIVGLYLLFLIHQNRYWLKQLQ